VPGKYFKDKTTVCDTNKILDTLISNISQISEVQSIGISRSKTPLPKAGEGDIDIFIYCDRIPALEKRQSIINGLGNRIQESRFNVFEGGHWGTGDFLLINGIETWLMYFTVSETLEDYIPPIWPEEKDKQQKQMHFDFQVPDVESAVEYAISLGATKAGLQFGGSEFVTMIDPSEHPFCLCSQDNYVD
jgi:hypothetical protein